jgi:hypothetical protein
MVVAESHQASISKRSVTEAGHVNILSWQYSPVVLDDEHDGVWPLLWSDCIPKMV